MAPQHVATTTEFHQQPKGVLSSGRAEERLFRRCSSPAAAAENKPDFGAEFNKSGKDGAAKIRLQSKRPARGSASPPPSAQTVPLRQMSEKRRSDVCTAWSTFSGNQSPERSFWKRTGTSQGTEGRARTAGSSWCWA